MERAGYAALFHAVLTRPDPPPEHCAIPKANIIASFQPVVSEQATRFTMS